MGAGFRPRLSVKGLEPPRLQRTDAAERPLIADTMADDWRVVTAATGLTQGSKLKHAITSSEFVCILKPNSRAVRHDLTTPRII